jgi:hypothetical protein
VSAASAPGAGADIAPVGAGDLADLLPLMRGYCEFYGVAPTDEALLAVARTLIADPAREGVQLLARDRRAARPASRRCSGCGRPSAPRGSGS